MKIEHSLDDLTTVVVESAQPAPAPARPPAKPVGGLSLILRALSDRLKRLFKRS
jgi:hypothetical protein